MRLCSKACLASGLNLLLFSAAVSAAQPDRQRDSKQNDSGTDEPVLVVTAQRVPADLQVLANNTGLLSAEEITLIGQTHINEALSRIPGTWISRGNGQEHLTAIRSPVFTGPGSCAEFLMMQDGIPLRAKGFCNVNQLFDANHEQAGSIEVVRGANSAVYGSNAIHGLVNILSKRIDRNSAAVGLNLGPHDYTRLSGEWTNAMESNAFGIFANATHDGGYKESSGFDQQKLNLSHQYSGEVTVDTLLTASNLNQDTAGFLQQGPDAYKEEQFRRQNDFPEAYRNATSWRLQSNISGETAGGHGWQLTPYLRTNQMDFLMHFLPGQPVEENGHDSFGILWQSNLELASGQFLWGIDSEFTQGELNQFQQEATMTGSAFLNQVLPQGLQYDYQVDANSAAVYGQWQQALASDWRWLLSVRYDYLEYDYDNRMLDGNTRDDGSLCGFGGCRYTRPADRSDSFENISWSTSLAYQLSRNWFSYLKLDKAFRAPETSELYRLQNGQQIADVDSQNADAIEWGFRYQTPALNFESVLFYLDKDDVIIQNSDREYINGAATRHQGIEIAYNHSLSKSWQLAANLTYADHTYTRNIDLNGSGDPELKGNQIDTAPELLGNLRVRWMPNEAILSELEWIYLDEYYTNPDNTRFYEGHQLLNWRAQLAMSDNWQLLMRITNLTDENYAERADFAFGNDRYFVGEPRSWFLELRGQWD